MFVLIPPIHIFLTLFLLLLQQSSAQNSFCPVILQPDQPTRQLTVVPPRIINGDIAATRLTKSLAVVINTRAFCTATILSSRWVLTAAHCKPTTKSTLVISPTSFTQNGTAVQWIGGTQIAVQSVHKHPSYTFSDLGLSFDIAALRLAKPVPKRSIFISINVNRTIPLATSFTRALGYGRTESASFVNMPRQVDIPVVSNSACDKVFGDKFNITSHVCAGYMQGGCSPCYGDSGGPLLQYNNQNAVQLGIVSYGSDEGCATPGMPTVFVRTAVHVGWLRKVGVQFTEEGSTRAIFDGTSSKRFSESASSIVLIVFVILGGLAIAGALGFFVVRRWKKHRVFIEEPKADPDASLEQSGSMSFSFIWKRKVENR